MGGAGSPGSGRRRGTGHTRRVAGVMELDDDPFQVLFPDLQSLVASAIPLLEAVPAHRGSLPCGRIPTGRCGELQLIFLARLNHTIDPRGQRNLESSRRVGNESLQDAAGILVHGPDTDEQFFFWEGFFFPQGFEHLVGRGHPAAIIASLHYRAGDSSKGRFRGGKPRALSV